MENIEERLLEKATEAFIMSIEIYNKPTIKYRIEGFSLFICNAWELMLKAHLIKQDGIESIYYDDNHERTITLENCIKKIFTNNKDPLRLNLEKIIELRNTSTHFITEEYEMLYVPLFQACVLNFTEKIEEFHSIDMTQYIPQNFLTLSVSMKELNEQSIKGKYDDEVANKLLKYKNELSSLSESQNSRFAITIEHQHFITKNKKEATSFVSISKDADTEVTIIKEYKDPNQTHKYNVKNALPLINKQLKKNGIDFSFNKYHFGLFIDYYGLKGKSEYCFIYGVHGNNSFSYSMKTIDLIVSEYVKDPENIIENLKKGIKKS